MTSELYDNFTSLKGQCKEALEKKQKSITVDAKLLLDVLNQLSFEIFKEQNRVDISLFQLGNELKRFTANDS